MTTFYVSKTGSNGDGLSLATAKTTVLAGTALLSAGDTLEIDSGTYTEGYTVGGSSVWVVPGGSSSSARTTIRAKAGATVELVNSVAQGGIFFFKNSHIHIIGNAGLAASKIAGTAPSGVLRFKGGATVNPGNGNVGSLISCDAATGGNDIIFDGVEVTNPFESTEDGGHHGISVINYPDFVIRNSWIHDIHHDPATYAFGSNALYVYGNNALVENNLIENVNSAAIRFGPNSAPLITGMIARNNVIRGPVGYAALLVFDHVAGALFYNNIVDATNGAIVAGLRAADVFSGATFANNTLYNAQYPFYLQNGGTIVLQNNISYSATNSNNDFTGTTVTATNNLGSTAGTGITTIGNPLFMNTGTSDFHLQASSPAIGAGTNLSSTFTTDADGVSRGASWEIGAYEYAPPPTPTPGSRLAYRFK
jgi:hypothetical protein